MGNTPPKFGVGGWGVRCGGQSAVKVTEKENWEEKEFFLVTLVLGGFDP